MSIVLGRDLQTLYAFGATSPALVSALEKNGAKFVQAKDVPGFPSRLVNNNWRDIGPHVGFAYRALRRGQIVRPSRRIQHELFPAADVWLERSDAA